MEILLVLLAVAVAVGLKYASAVQIRDAHMEAARALHLDFQWRGWLRGGERLSGIVDGYIVRVESRSPRRNPRGTSVTCFEVDGGGKVPATIKLGKETLGSTLGKVVGLGGIAIGDPVFDRVVMTKGPTLILSALLDARTREILQWQVAEKGLEVDKGLLKVDASARLRRADHIIAQVRSLVRLTDRLTLEDGERLPGKLRRSAEGDPHTEIRGQCLSYLLDHYPQHHETGLARASAMLDEDPALRLRGALASGEAGQGVLEQLVMGVEVPDEIRGRAVGPWAAGCAPKRRGGAILEALEALGPRAQRCPELAAALFRACVEYTLSGALDVLERHAELVGTGDPSEALAEALAALGQPQRSTVALVKLLHHDHLRTRLVAAEALSRLGDLRAVGPLGQYTQGLLVDTELKTLALRAIEQIQSREGPSAAGGLSVVGEIEKEGALSFDARGKLSTLGASDSDDSDKKQNGKDTTRE